MISNPHDDGASLPVVSASWQPALTPRLSLLWKGAGLSSGPFFWLAVESRYGARSDRADHLGSDAGLERSATPSPGSCPASRGQRAASAVHGSLVGLALWA